MASDLGYGAPQNATQPQAFDPGALQVIRPSASRLARDQDALIRQLHYDVAGLIPDSAIAPSLDMWAFCDRMVRSLLWVALTDQPLYVITDTLRQVGAQNWFEGFPDSQYPSLAHALVQTVHYLSGNAWTASTGSAWISYFMWVRPYLLAGAEHAAAQHAAEQQAAEQQAAEQRALAEQEAARVEALSRDARGGHTQVVGDVNLEKVASLLDDDDDDVGYGQIMVSMTRNRREPPRHQELAAAQPEDQQEQGVSCHGRPVQSGIEPGLSAPGEGFEPSLSGPKPLVLPIGRPGTAAHNSTGNEASHMCSRSAHGPRRTGEGTRPGTTTGQQGGSRRESSHMARRCEAAHTGFTL